MTRDEIRRAQIQALSSGDGYTDCAIGQRMWREGDPEPPADVTLLRVVHESDDPLLQTQLPWLHRVPGGWAWSSRPDYVDVMHRRYSWDEVWDDAAMLVEVLPQAGGGS